MCAKKVNKFYYPKMSKNIYKKRIGFMFVYLFKQVYNENFLYHFLCNEFLSIAIVHLSFIITLYDSFDLMVWIS